MYAKKRYPLKSIVIWTRKELLFFVIYCVLVCFFYVILHWEFLDIPWTPIALIGTAVVFLLAFQINAAYGRIWEARIIWGGIVNSSRTWGMMVRDFVSNHHKKEPIPEEELTEIKKTLTYRHFAWLTTLRYAMREHKKWEEFEDKSTNIEWMKMINIPEKKIPLEIALNGYLTEEEFHYVLSKNNKSTAVLYLQSKHLSELKDRGLIWEFSYIKLEDILEELFDLKGKSERIKNFPYPKQFSSLTYYFTWILILLLPIGLVPEFSKIGLALTHTHESSHYFVWLVVPFCVVVSWIFHTTMRISLTGDNPFEGSPNDVPISSIARSIEIDMRQMLDEPENTIPKQFEELSDVQM